MCHGAPQRPKHNVIEVKAQFLFSQKVSFYISLTTMGTVLFTPYEKNVY